MIVQTDCIPGGFNGICCPSRCLYLNKRRSEGSCLKNTGECKLVKVCGKGESNLLSQVSTRMSIKKGV